MGLEPGTTKADVRRCLENWNKGDNGILFLSRAYRLQPGTGWQINPRHPARARLARHLRAAGQQRRVRDVPVRGRRPHRRLGACSTKDVLPEHHHDLDYLVEHARLGRQRQSELRRRQPRVPEAGEAVRGDRAATGYREQWVCYGTRLVLGEGADRAAEAHGHDQGRAAYGIILTQGYGTFGTLPVSTPSMIRFGQMTEDELFVTADAAQAGVRIENLSDTDPLVILKHFGPGNPDAESTNAIGSADD